MDLCIICFYRNKTLLMTEMRCRGTCVEDFETTTRVVVKTNKKPLSRFHRKLRRFFAAKTITRNTIYILVLYKQIQKITTC